MIRIFLKSVINIAAFDLISACSLSAIIHSGISGAAVATVSDETTALSAPSLHKSSLMRMMMMKEMESNVQGHSQWKSVV